MRDGASASGAAIWSQKCNRTSKDLLNLAFAKERKSLVFLEKKRGEQGEEGLHQDSPGSNRAMGKTGSGVPGSILSSVLVGCLTQVKFLLDISI